MWKPWIDQEVLYIFIHTLYKILHCIWWKYGLYIWLHTFPDTASIISNFPPALKFARHKGLPFDSIMLGKVSSKWRKNSRTYKSTGMKCRALSIEFQWLTQIISHVLLFCQNWRFKSVLSSLSAFLYVVFLLVFKLDQKSLLSGITEA